MDSWTEKQIAAMDKAGGNAKLVEFFKARGIEKGMKIATKYNTKQAQYYRDRLSRWLEGKTEPPPDPGRFDPATGVSEAQGAEPLPGETTDQYNARQAKLRDAARERMRAKFGDGGLGGLGASGSVAYDGNGGGGGGGGEGLGNMLGGALSGVGSFLKEKVIENEKLRETVGGAVTGVGQVAGGAYNKLRESERFGGAAEKVGGVVGGILGKAGEKLGASGGAGSNTGDDYEEIANRRKMIVQQEKDFWDSMYQKKDADGGEATRPSSSPAVSPFQAKTTSPVKSTSPIKAKAFKADDDDWGDWDDFEAKPSPGAGVLGTLVESGKAAIGVIGGDPSTLDDPKLEPQRSKSEPTHVLGGTNNAINSDAPVPSAPTKPAKPPMMETAPAPVTKKASAKLQSADDFFADFGV